MAFHALLRDLNDQVFLIHASSDERSLSVGLLVIDGHVQDSFMPVGEQPGLGGAAFMVQLPPELINQPGRYKGFDVTLPIRRLNAEP